MANQGLNFHGNDFVKGLLVIKCHVASLHKVLRQKKAIAAMLYCSVCLIPNGRSKFIFSLKMNNSWCC